MNQARGARPLAGWAREALDVLGIVGSLLHLIWRRKLWWLVPLVLVLLVMAALIMLEATPVGPLIYPLF